MLKGKPSWWPGALPATAGSVFRIGVEVGDVGRLHARIGRVGKGRIEVPAVRRDAAQHGVGEIVERPGADAVLGIGRNVRRHEGAERRLQLEAAGQFELRGALGFRPRMAGRAAAGTENALAARRIAGPERGKFRGARGVSASSETRTPPRRPPQGRARRRRAFADRPMPGQPFLMPIGLVAAAAISADRAELRAERIDILRRAPRPPRRASALNLSTAAWKPAMSSQIFGEAVVSPLSLPAGNRRVDIDLLPRWPAAPAARSAPPRRRTASRPWPSWRARRSALPLLLHDGLAVGNRIGKGGRYGEREGRDGKYKLSHESPPVGWRKHAALSLTTMVAENHSGLSLHGCVMIRVTERRAAQTKSPGSGRGFSIDG